MKNGKVDVQRIAVAGGLTWSGLLFVTTLLSVYTGFAAPFLNGIASIYLGFNISLLGSVIGAIYGFFDVYIGVYIFAWVYRSLGK